MLRTSNPVMRERTFEVEHAYADRMTVDGTVNRCLVMLALVTATAVGVWVYVTAGTGALVAERANVLIPLWGGGAIGGLVLALITMFRKQSSGVTAPLYALAEGLVIGALSAWLETLYPGIALQAGALTVLVLFVMLGLYKAKVLRATARFRSGMMMAMSAILLFYLASFVSSMFGFSLLGNLFAANPLLSIGLSVVICAVAAFRLILDFDLIERGAARGAPKYFEWYGAFALTMTLIWLYIEIIILLSKLRRR